MNQDKLEQAAETTEEPQSGDAPTVGLPNAVVIDAVCDQFEDAWKSEPDTPPDITDYLNRGSDRLADLSLLALELILIDREYRRRAGSEVTQDEYCARLAGMNAVVEQAFSDSPRSIRTTTPGEPDTVSGSPLTTSVGDRVRYFGDYELVEEIARGGMGVVYRAKQLSLNRVIALKMILAGTIADAESIRRFQLEAEAAANLDHPGIVPIYDIGEHQGHHYFSMKLIEGKTLSQVAQSLRDEPARAVETVAKIAEAVHHAHQRGILHRDLKPGNVLIDQDGQPVVTDFGLARKAEANQQLTQTGAVVGTPGFMSPEQASGAGGVTTATDVYSLGAILYELLCGKPPHAKATVIDTLLAVVNEDPLRPRELNPDVSSDLELICLKALAKDPAQRYTSAGAFAEDLRAHLAGEPIALRAPSFVELMRLWVSKNYGNVVWLPIVALIVGGLSGFSMWVATMGQDQSARIPLLESFSDSIAQWQLVNWHPFRTPAVILFFLLMTTMGWATATLVKTKNRAADLGAGLSVGLLAGLIAFIFGMGALFASGGLNKSDHDEWILHLSAAGNLQQADELIAGSYPKIKDLPRSQRADLLMRKIESDRAAAIVKWNFIGTIVCLLLFGYVGTTQTLVAGSLRRETTLLKAIVGYSCFSFGLVALGLIVGTELSMIVQQGSGSIIHWTLPILCLVGIVVGCWLVWRQYAWGWQVGVTTGWLLLFVPLVGQMFFTLPAPMVARLRSDIRNAKQAVASNPDNVRQRIRLSEAHSRFGDALSQVGWYPDAFDHYQAAGDVVKDLDAAEPVEHRVKNLHANALFAQARMADEMGDPKVAAEIYADLVAEYYASRDVMDGYAQAVWESGLNPAEMIKLPDDEQPWGWYRTARLLRWLHRYQSDSLSGDVQRRGIPLNVLAEQVLERGTGQITLSAQRRQRLKQWLASHQQWELYGPYSLELGSDPTVAKEMEALEVAYGPEQALITGGDLPVADEVLKIPTGLPVELTDLLADRQGVVGYARTEFQVASTQSITFRLGSNDGVKMWIDGEVVHRNDQFRDHVEASDLVTVDLDAGNHELVLKITQGTATWGFLIDACDTEGWPLPLWGGDNGK